jgi:hypothetical protein
MTISAISGVTCSGESARHDQTQNQARGKLQILIGIVFSFLGVGTGPSASVLSLMSYNRAVLFQIYNARRHQSVRVERIHDCTPRLLVKREELTAEAHLGKNSTPATPKIARFSLLKLPEPGVISTRMLSVLFCSVEMAS